MTVLGKVAVPKVSVPKPINLPSQKYSIYYFLSSYFSCVLFLKYYISFDWVGIDPF